MKEIDGGLFRTTLIDYVVEKRRAMVWQEHFKNYYNAIDCVSKMQNFYLAHAGGFHHAVAKIFGDTMSPNTIKWMYIIAHSTAVIMTV